MSTPPPPPPPAPSRSDLTHASNLTILSVLSTPGPKRPALPVEIILQILTHPSRWVQSAQLSLASPLSVSSVKGCTVILCAPPLTSKSIRLLRSVVFTFTSHDQGWSSFYSNHGTYENSWTWFDVVVGSGGTGSSIVTDLDRLELEDDDDWGPDPEIQSRFHWAEKKIQRLQSNRHASRVAEAYRFELEVGQGILQDLKEGDEIALLASAVFPGWVNNIEEAAMEIWEVDELE